MSIDVLRGSAALAVLLVHIKHYPPNSPLNLRFFLLLPLEFGGTGVPLFVVLSGFCIHLGVAKRMARTGVIRADWVAFWKRRFYRLYPPYLAAIALGVASFYASRTEVMDPFQWVVSLPHDVLAHLVMVANAFEDYWAGVGNFPLWTLCMEEQLYLLYAAYVLLRRRIGTRVMWVALGVTAAWMLGQATILPATFGRPPLTLGQWGKWPFAYWFNWVIGAVAAEAYAGVMVLPAWCARRSSLWGAMAIGIVCHPILMGRLAGARVLERVAYGPDLARAFELATLVSSPALALAFFVLVNRWVRAETRGEFGGAVTTRLAGLGLFSYSLYLTHIPVLNLAESYFHLGHGLDALAFRYAVFTPMCIGIAYLFYRLIESRFITAPAPKVAREGVLNPPPTEA